MTRCAGVSSQREGAYGGAGPDPRVVACVGGTAATTTARVATPLTGNRMWGQMTSVPDDRDTVFLADDNLLVREGVRALINLEPLEPAQVKGRDATVHSYRLIKAAVR